jgi:hypothetical protein
MDYYNATGIYDNSTYSNFGTFQNGLNYSNLTTGARGKALSFDGNDDSIQPIVPMNGMSNWTISGWINPKVGDNSENHPFEFSPFQLWVTGGDTLNFYYGNSLSYSSLVYGTWTQVTLLANSSGRCLFVNGNFVGCGSTCTINSNTFNIGMYSGGGSYNFNGSLDEVMIFNRSLSQSEISALYDSQSNKFNTSSMNLANGQHNYTVYAIDSSGNAASSGWRYFTLGGTCIYTSGNWNINCSESCSISTNVNVGGNNISIIGVGTITTSANISNYGNLHIQGTDSTHICKVRCVNGGCFKD